ncbi:phospho-sugar mutase [Nakamurella antarctica]|uniref:Phospho-sugar mutase n=1 Tax=Nakamurella antarctica TaxID=1902245 RepID=A0A3G8ZVS7_9ACTN|nr:phospho-sugar mutase [Nakamurella antarctica]AZI58564.1 phospho-sugar mutase [Nakamurella antarctica]
MSATALDGDLRRAVVRWIADDPSPADAAELKGILADAMAGDAAAIGELTDRMSAPLAFGTAGLRGPLRAGPAGMNLAVVRRAAAGIAAYLRNVGSAGESVVIGYDARHRSAEFAHDAAGVLAAAGFRVLLAPSALPTPLTAFGVRSLGAVAGLMVTASHNPPNDNGLKVYLAGGTQLVWPADVQIEAAIAAAPAGVAIDATGQAQPWPDSLIGDYLDRAAAVATGGAKSLRIAATPMHGVGGETLVKALYQAGFSDVHMVAEQAVPDPDFPTVAFPNPEEPGAADLLLALATAIDADLAIANDPDADRCAIGIKDVNGIWRMLTGNETGALLGDRVLRGLDRGAHPDPLVATTIVSSAMLKSIAAQHDVRFDETLTGFKWIVRAGDGDGTGLVFGFEEALGLCVDPTVVRDKDGISAAVLACDLAATLKAGGRHITDALDDLARQHGLHATDQLSFRVADLSLITDGMARLRGNIPIELLGETVLTTKDLLPQTDAVVLHTERVRVVIRPSGTEPKLKCYLEIITPVGVDDDLTAIREASAGQLTALKSELREVLQLG